jgi:tetratricopeptide (TPR) repeat protein
MKKRIALPRHIERLLRQAITLQQNGAIPEAEDLYREILDSIPRHFDALQLLGALMLQSGRFDEGIELLRAAIDINSTQAPIHSNLAFALNAMQLHQEALDSADRAVALQRDFFDGLNNRGTALAGLDRAQEALDSFGKAISLRPEVASAWNNRACALRDLGRAQDALSSCDAAIQLQPAYAEAWSNRANALSDLKRPEEARENYLHALKLAPDFADAWNNLGLTLVDLNQHVEALACFDRALAQNQNHVEAHWNRSNCLLRMGRFREGWAEYEWRWKRRRIRLSQRRFQQPMWLGDFPIDGKIILLHAEQGLGDTIQFSRYAEKLAASGATVLLEVPPELVRLLQGLKGVEQLIEEGQPLPAFDCHCPLLSLPLAFKTDLESIPSPASYLHADFAEAGRWARRIRPIANNALKVGLVWAGGNRPHVAELRKNDERRSVLLEAFAPLLSVENVRFFSLQKGHAASQLVEMNARLPEDRRIIDFTDEIVDFADTASLVENLDVVISVDTSTAHLAGAMGKPVWILNRLDTCWRWMLQRNDSPWYCRANLYRQSALGDWDDVFQALEKSLRTLSNQRAGNH